MLTAFSICWQNQMSTRRSIRYLEGGIVNAYDVMHEWDRAVGNPQRTDEELDRDIPEQLSNGDFEGWKALLEARDVPAIEEGMRIWGLPIAPLGAFEMDENIETGERPDLLS
jgi:hypothetical protein